MEYVQQLMTVENLVALLTLTSLEIVLGIDNIVFIAILCGRLPPEQREKARIIGLALAMVMRIGLLLAITWVMKLSTVLFTIGWPIDHGFTGKDLVLVVGGLFLVAKATSEIHEKIEGAGHGHSATRVAARFGATIVQILLIDIVFSLDSVITAVGMAKSIAVMIIAVMISVGVMLAFSGYITRFVDRHPTVKMLALTFLVLIGVMLIAEGGGKHVEKGYIYFAMAFSLGVEMLNLWVRARAAKKSPPAAHPSA